jgi:hypothetical protein
MDKNTIYAIIIGAALTIAIILFVIFFSMASTAMGVT